MKGRLYANWLVIITLFLFFSSLVIFVISVKDTIGIKKCAFGDDVGTNCICSSDGKKICDPQAFTTSTTEEFSASNLDYTFDFLNMIDGSNSFDQIIKFVDISHLENRLKIVIEIESVCNEDNIVAPQLGLYKLEKNRLVLSIISNLTNESFNLPCISQNTFVIENFNINISEEFDIQYQDEEGMLYLANNCIYEGYIRNNKDVYNSIDGTLLCQCKDGKNICEKD